MTSVRIIACRLALFETKIVACIAMMKLPLAVLGAGQTDCSLWANLVPRAFPLKGCLWARDWTACCSKPSILRKKKELKTSGNSLNTLYHTYKNLFIICNILLAGFLKTLLSEVLVPKQNLQSSKYKN